jgi:hypothetical protein
MNSRTLDGLGLAALITSLGFVACPGVGPVRNEPPADDDDDATTDDDTADDDVADDDTAEDCPEGLVCVDSLPFVESNDTSASDSSSFDAYGCAPEIDESGPEVIYRVTVDEKGWLGVLLDDSADGVDIDAHILTDLDPDACEDRGHWDAGTVVDPGTYYVVADTWVEDGVPLAGAYGITIGLAPLAVGDCTMEDGWMARVGDGGDSLQMPATGPVVLEAHMVTVDDGYGSGANDPWPGTITEGVEDHYQLSQDTTGFVMYRDQSWCPQEGCEYGQGATGAKVPVDDEAWYVCMYWQSRPDPGTRMILMNGEGRAVVAAAGYETGPGDLSNVAGATEEIHRYLGTGHQSQLTVGFAVDPNLPLGPIDCP